MSVVETLRRELFQETKNVAHDIEVHTHLGRALIQNICRRLQPTFWLEVGSLFGGSAIRVADETKRMGLKTDIVCIDPFCGYAEVSTKDGSKRKWLGLMDDRQVFYEMFRENVAKAGHDDVILALPMTSVIGLPLIEGMAAAGTIPRPQVIYLDASHEYHETCFEIEKSLALLESGGLLVGDDYNEPGVQAALQGYNGCLSPIANPDQPVTQWMIRK